MPPPQQQRPSSKTASQQLQQQPPSSASKGQAASASAAAGSNPSSSDAAAVSKPKSRKESAQGKEKKSLNGGREISAGSSQTDSKRSASGGPNDGGASESLTISSDGKDAAAKGAELHGGGDGGPPLPEAKPKIDPEKLKFLQDPVPPEVFSKLDNILGKVVRSLPNLAVASQKTVAKQEEPSIDPPVIFSGTDVVDPLSSPEKPPPSSSVQEEELKQPDSAKLQAQPASIGADKKRTHSVAKLLEDPGFLTRGVTDDNLIKALKLRERRLKRRRDRAAGVPPDPNDSDDSLLAELKETTDDKLFPGVSFEDELDFADAVIDPSQFSTKLQFRDPRMLDTSKGKIINPSRKPDTSFTEPPKPDTDPEDFIRSLTPTSLSRYKKSIIKKHYKNGVLTMFKGKDEMKVSHAKVVAKKEIEAVRKAAKEKESCLIRLEEDLTMCRGQVTKGTAEATRLAREIKNMVNHEPRLKVSGLLVGRRQTNRLLSTPEDPLNFQIPTDPHLTQNRAFNALKEEYLSTKELVHQATQAIPLLEQAIIPTEHDLAALQLQENKLRELDQKLRESDVREEFEFQVVEEYKSAERERKRENRRRKEERERRVREEREEREKKEREVYEEILESKREKLRMRYEETKTQHDQIRKAQSDVEALEQSRKKKAMTDLFTRITKVRATLSKLQKSKESLTDDESDLGESLKLMEGEQDLSESLAIRQTRIQIKRRKLQADSEVKQKSLDQEKRKMGIMKKLLREEIIVNRMEYAEREERELHKALIGLVPYKEDRAFAPINYSETLEKALRKRKEEMLDRIKRVREIEKERMDTVLAPPHYTEKDHTDKSSVPSRQAHGIDPFPATTPLDVTEPNPKLALAATENTKIVRRFLPPPKLKPHKKAPQTTSPLLSTLSSAPPFTANPSEIIFADYDPEKVYRKKLLLTNTSCQVNTFRQLPIPVDIASYFEVLARPPGRMSAGMVCEVEVVFRPPPGYDQDVTNGVVTFSAEHGGDFIVKVGCSTRKCRPRIASVGGTGIIVEKLDTLSTPRTRLSVHKSGKETTSTAVLEGRNKIVVDFGTCVLGDTVSRVLEIMNDGALPTDFEIEEISGSRVEEVIESIEKEGMTDRNSGRDVLFDLLASKYLKSETLLAENEGKPDELMDEDESVPALAVEDTLGMSETSAMVVETQKDEDPSDIDQRNFTVAKNEHGLLPGHGSIPIHIEFSPPYVEPTTLDPNDPDMAKRPPKKIAYQAFYIINFKLKNVNPLIIECRARHRESPLFLDINEIDFSTCVVGSTYRLPLVIRNRSNIALKFWVEPIGIDRKMTMEPIHSAHADVTDPIGSCLASDGIDSEEEEYAVSRDAFSEDPFGNRSESLVEGKSGRLSVGPSYGFETSMMPPMLVSYAHADQYAMSAIQPRVSFKHEGSKRKTGKRKTQKSKRSDSLTMQIPKIGEVEVSPRLAFIQPFEPFTVWCKIRPSRGSLGLRENGCHPFKIPLVVKFNNHGIESPLSLSLTGSITTSDLSFILPNGGTSELSFGSCSVYLTKEVSIRIWNQSTLPQIAKFVSSSQSLSVVSNRKVMTETGLTVIPPMSQIIKKIRFEPKETGTHNFRLICQSIWERKFEIICTGIAVKPLLRFSASFIQFRTTSMGSYAEAKVKLLRDKSENEVRKPKEAWKENATINFDELYKDEYDVVGFEFGDPELISVRTRNGGYLTATQLSAIQKEIRESLKKDAAEAEEAVKKANKSTAKEIKIITGTNVHAWEEKFNPTDFAKLFEQESTIIQNRRVLIQRSMDGLSETPSDRLPPAIGRNDTPPIDISPRKGSLPPGKSVSISIVLCPPTITALASLRGDGDKDTDSTGSPSTDDTTAKNRPPSAVKGSQERASRSRQGTAGTERIKAEETILKNGGMVKSSLDQLTAVKLYKGVDDTCLTFLVPCTVRRSFRPQTEPERPKSRPGTIAESQPIDDSNTIYLEIVAPIVRPDILLTDPDSGTLDFDKVPVGKTVVQMFTIQNITDRTLKLQHEGLDPAGPFSISKPLEDLGPEGSQVVEIAFNPMGEATFLADFVVFTTTTQIRARLRGNGTIPTLQIEPSEPLIYMGDVPIGDVTTKSFKICNTGQYPLNCTLSLSTVHPLQPYPRTYGTVNFSRQNAFSLSTTQLTIPTGTKQEVTVKFSPDRESDLFFDHITIDVWGIPKPHVIKLHGRCWDTSTALVGYDPPPETMEEDPFALPPRFEFEFAQKMYSGNFPVELSYYDLFPTEKPIASPLVTDGLSSQNALLAGATVAPAQRNGSAEPKKAKGKDSSKDSGAAAMTEEFLGDLLKMTSRETVRFVTVTCPWKKHEHRNTWFVETRELQIVNLKPTSFAKPETTKRPPVAEYTIEPWSGTFEYMELYNEYVQLPPPKMSLDDTMARFIFADSAKGTLELGTSKSFKIQIHNPVKEFWAAMKNYEDIFNLKITNPIPPSVPQSHKLPHQDPFSSSLSLSRKSINTQDDTKHAPPPPIAPRISHTDAPDTSYLSPSTSLPPEARPATSGRQRRPSVTTLDVQGADSGTSLEVGGKGRRRSSTSRSNLSLAVMVDPLNEFSCPARIESCFRVTVRGGYRYVDPKGVPGPTEGRVWIVKVVAEVPPLFARPAEIK
ncbi:hypothetical protein HDU67_003774 [Dinochytrium kinnereticum]|nr:hypothetical protein HDU67_003774 [Dinochytrium kinnereticum]